MSADIAARLRDLLDALVRERDALDPRDGDDRLLDTREALDTLDVPALLLELDEVARG